MPEIPRHSLIVWQTKKDGPGDTPRTVLPAVIDRMREMNRLEPARELSLAITECQRAEHWLRDLDERREKGQHDREDSRSA